MGERWNLCSIPFEVLQVIVGSLSIYDISRLSRTCKRLRDNVEYSPEKVREFFSLGEFDALLSLRLLDRFGKSLERIFSSEDGDALKRSFATVSDPGFWHSEMIIKLAPDPRIDVKANDDLLFRLACLRGDLRVVAFLLSDSRVNPLARHNQGMASACEQGFTSIVEILLQGLAKRWPQNPMLLHVPFVRACYKGHLNIIRIFLDFDRQLLLIRPAVIEGLKLAALADQLPIVQCILDHEIGQNGKEAGIALVNIVAQGRRSKLGRAVRSYLEEAGLFSLVAIERSYFSYPLILLLSFIFAVIAFWIQQ